MACVKPFNIWLVVLNLFMVMSFSPLPLLNVFCFLIPSIWKEDTLSWQQYPQTILLFPLQLLYLATPATTFLGPPKLQDTLFLKTSSSRSSLTLSLLPNSGLKQAHLACGNKHRKCTMTLEFLPEAKNCVPDLRHLRWYAQWRHSGIYHSNFCESIHKFRILFFKSFHVPQYWFISVVNDLYPECDTDAVCD